MAYAQPKKQVDSDAQGIAQAPQQGSSLLSFAQQRLWFLNQLEPLYGLVASIRDGKHGPSNRVEALAAHYIQRKFPRSNVLK